ncbi:MAG: aspartate-semialdehyde dehydrogenase [Myxococcota bacterium]
MTIRCALVGATGIAGQQFLAALARHPYLELAQLAASSRSAGKTLKQALTQESGLVSWYAEEIGLEAFGDRRVVDAAELDLTGIGVVFSAVESDAARVLEGRYAATTPVVSTASAYRYERDVPIIIPAVNGDHAELVHRQRVERGWSGFIVPIPNCTTTGLAIALAPLHRAFQLERAVVTSMQAVSGAGRSPGVLALDVTDNIVPFIKNEEEKVQRETRKLLGVLEKDGIMEPDVPISATCTRVPVLEGHTESVVAAFRQPFEREDAVRAMETFGRNINPQTHPSAPEQWITVFEDPARPQVRLDRDKDGGMTTSVGRVRHDTVLGPHGLRFMLVSHNTKMGAARGAVLVAEDLASRGLLA